MDYQVGRILSELEHQGILDDTIIVYTSDHGEMLGDYNCFGKRSMLNSASRVPMLVRYPALFELRSGMQAACEPGRCGAHCFKRSGNPFLHGVGWGGYGWSGPGLKVPAAT